MTPVILGVTAFLAVVALIAYNVRHFVVKRPLEREWTQVSDVDLDREYLVIVTHYPLKAGRRTSRVLNYLRLVQRQLDQSEGLVGYAFRANFYRQQIWTLSVWADPSALQAFLDGVSHQQASDDLKAYVGESKTRQWPILGRDVPPSWDEALAQLDDPATPSFRSSERGTSSVG
ncbi:MAG: hypothetical protein ABEK03_06300 [Candidatus Bipolaricaulia bacterium]